MAKAYCETCDRIRKVGHRCGDALRKYKEEQKFKKEKERQEKK